MKKLISVILMLVMMASYVSVDAAGTVGSGKCGPDIDWHLADDGILTLNGTGQMYQWKSSEIPWGNYSHMITGVVMSEGITTVSSGAFSDCCLLASVEMPDSVKKIGSSAFFNCDSLKNIDFLSCGISRIESGLFSNCDGLTNIVIPENILYLSSDAFWDCKNIKQIYISSSVLKGFDNPELYRLESLESITVSKENPQYYSVDGILYTFDSDVTGWLSGGNLNEVSVKHDMLLIGCPPQKTGDVIIPYNTKKIESRSFRNCSKITSVTIPDSVKNIDYDAFEGCNNVTDVYLEGEKSNWYNIGNLNNKFKNANVHYVEQSPVRAGITSGICGDSSSWSFINGTLCIWGSGKIETQSQVTDGRLWHLPPWTHFSNDITSIYISEGITSIGDNAFRNCKNLKSVAIPEGVSHIGDYAFAFCFVLESITLPSTLKYIGESAFINTAYQRNQGNWKDNLLYIGNWIISAQQMIESQVYISAMVNGVAEDAFLYCSSIPSFNVDTNNPHLCSVDGVLFSKDMTKLIKYPGAKELSYYAIPYTVKELSATAFNACRKLNTILIPEGVTHIYPNTFYGTYNLTEIYIPKTIRVIEGTSLVAYSSGMTTSSLNLYYPGTNTELDTIIIDNNIRGLWQKDNPRDFIFITDVDVKINNASLIFDQTPIIKNSRTLVPLRTIFEMLGAKVEWDGSTQTVTATKGGTTIVMTIGSNKMYKNGVEITLDVPPEIINSRTLVPVRAVAESFDCAVEWDGENYTVNISTVL